MNNHVLEYAFSKQYDEGRVLLFTVTENGLPYKLDEVLAIFQMKKPDGTIIFDNGIVEDNKLKIILTSQMTILTGKMPYQIQLIKDKNVFTTVTGCLKVEKSVVDPDDVISSDEFNALNDLLIKSNKDYTYVMKSAQASADAAKISEDNAKVSETNTKLYEDNAKESEINAADSADIATKKADIASDANITANEKADEATNSAKESKSYAVGTNNEFRENDAVDNSKYYYEQARSISEGLNGTLLPMGTITFSQLSIQNVSPGYMYNISDSFVTDSTFKDGAGFTYPEGTNVYYTSDGYWDCLAGTQVTSVNGKKGNVVLNSSDIIKGLGFTPVHQGGGTGQTNNKIYIGWSNENKLKAQVDNVDMGNIVTTGVNNNVILPISKGGTGKTSGVDAANALINNLDTATSTPLDDDYYISQYAGGGTKITTYHRRPMSALWNYIKGKLATVLGIKYENTKSSNISSGNTTKIIDAFINDNGTFLIYVFLDYQITSATGNRQLLLYKNGVAIDDARMEISANPNGWTRINTCYPTTLSSSDSISVYGYQNSGSSCNVICSIKFIKII